MLAKNHAMIILIAGLLAIAGALCLCFSGWEIAGFLAAGFALICVQALGAAHDRTAMARRRARQKRALTKTRPAAQRKAA